MTCTCNGAAHREAAKYRRRLRDVEAQRDALLERVGVLERAIASELVRIVGQHPSEGNLWRAVLQGDLSREVP